MASSRTCWLGAFALLLCGVSWPGLGRASAAESQPVKTVRSVLSLVTDADSVEQGKPFHAAIRLSLAPGWHTYWHNPGDAGLPPDFAIEAPGASVGAVRWPYPQVIRESTLTTYGYTGDVVFPVEITPSGGVLDLRVHAEWLVCKDICVPEQADLSLSLPVSASPAPSRQGELIAAALKAVPTPIGGASRISDDGALTLNFAGAGEGTSAQFFPDAPGVVETNTAVVRKVGDDQIAVQMAGSGKQEPGASRDGVLTVSGPSGPIAAFTVGRPGTLSASVNSIFPLLLLALGGGLLLNLMPCVFPVLAMKAMALARISGADVRRVREEAASYCVGVVLSFAALGGAVIALRSAGESVGWGFQFQSPVFVTVVAWLLFAVGLSLSGVYEIGGSLMGRGQSLAGRGGRTGSFFTGVLAVAVASPCTAPFMGTAIAGAVALSSGAALAVFAAMGLGLALPYAVFAAVPRLARTLPRPGAWMKTLQQLLAFPMYAATVWLMWVVSQQTGPAGVLAAGSGLLAVGFAAWALGTAPAGSRLGRIGRHGAAGAMAVLLIGLVVTSGEPALATSEPFTEAKLAELRADGRPVFVNMTAAWCLSCLVNERVALSREPVRAAFSRANVAYLKGDWTNKNPAISEFLRQQGRDGVPLYVFYAPGQTPTVLPQILSEATVLAAIGTVSPASKPAS